MEINIPATVRVPLGRDGVYGFMDVDTTKFAPHVLTHVWDYGLRQSLNDAIADKYEADEDGNKILDANGKKILLPVDVIVAKAQTRLDNFYAGELRTRNAAEPIDPVENWVHKLAKAAINKMYIDGGLYKSVPKGTKNRMLYVCNMRRESIRLEPCADDAEMVAEYMRTSPRAANIRKTAERNVREAMVAADEAATAV